MQEYLQIHNFYFINHLHFFWHNTSFSSLFTLYIQDSVTVIAIALICFISVLGLSTIYLATSNTSKTIEPKPAAEVTYCEKEIEKNNSYSDIVWTDFQGSSYSKFIFDQDNPDGVRLISILGRPTTRVETYTVNGVQYVGLLHRRDYRNSLPNDQLKRGFNRVFFWKHSKSYFQTWTFSVCWKLCIIEAF